MSHQKPEVNPPSPRNATNILPSPIKRSTSQLSYTSAVGGQPSPRLPNIAEKGQFSMASPTPQHTADESEDYATHRKAAALPHVHRNMFFGHIKGGYAITKLRQLQGDKDQRRKFMNKMAEVPGAKRIANLSPQKGATSARRSKHPKEFDADSVTASSDESVSLGSDDGLGQGPFVIVTKGGMGTHLLSNRRNQSKPMPAESTPAASPPQASLPEVKLPSVAALLDAPSAAAVVDKSSAGDDAFESISPGEFSKSSGILPSVVMPRRGAEETFLTRLNDSTDSNDTNLISLTQQSSPHQSRGTADAALLAPPQQREEIVTADAQAPCEPIDNTAIASNEPDLKGRSFYSNGAFMAQSIKAARDRRGAALAIIRKHHQRARIDKEERAAAATRRRNQAVFGHQWATEWMVAIKLVRSLIGLLPVEVATASEAMAVRRRSGDHDLKDIEFSSSGAFASTRKARNKAPTDHHRLVSKKRSGPKADKALSGLLWDALARHQTSVTLGHSTFNPLAPNAPSFGNPSTSSPRRAHQLAVPAEVRRNKCLQPAGGSRAHHAPMALTLLSGGFLPDLLWGRRLRCRQALLFLMARWWRIKTFRRTYRVAHIRFNFILRKNLPFFIDTFRTKRRTENIPLVVRFLRQYKMAATVSRALNIYTRHVKYIQRFIRRRQVVKRLLCHAMRLQWEVVGRELCYNHRLPSFLTNIAAGPAKLTTAMLVPSKNLTTDTPTYIGFNHNQSPSPSAFTSSTRPPPSFVCNEESIHNSCYVPIPTSIREAVIKRAVQHSLALEAAEIGQGLNTFLQTLGRKEASHQSRLDKVLHSTIKGYMALPTIVESAVWCISNEPRLLSDYGRKDEAFATALTKITDHTRKRRHLETTRRLKAEQEHRAGIAGAILKRLQLTGGPSSPEASYRGGAAAKSNKGTNDNEEEEEPIYFTDAEQRAVRAWGVMLYVEAERVKEALRLGTPGPADESRRQSMATALVVNAREGLIDEEPTEPMQASVSFGSKASLKRRYSKGFIDQNAPVPQRAPRPVASPNTKMRIAPQSLLSGPAPAPQPSDNNNANTNNPKIASLAASPIPKSLSKPQLRHPMNILRAPLNAPRTRLLMEHGAESLKAEERLDQKRVEELKGMEGIANDVAVCKTSERRRVKVLLPFLDPTSDSYRVLRSADFPQVLLGKHRLRSPIASKKTIANLIQSTVSALWQAQQVYCHILAEHAIKFESSKPPQSQAENPQANEEDDEEVLGLDDLGVFANRRYSLKKALIESQLLLGEVPVTVAKSPAHTTLMPPVDSSPVPATSPSQPSLAASANPIKTPKSASPPKSKASKGGRSKRRVSEAPPPPPPPPMIVPPRLSVTRVEVPATPLVVDYQPEAPLGMLALGKLNRPHQSRLCFGQLYKMLHEPGGSKILWDQFAAAVGDERQSRDLDEEYRLLTAKERLQWAVEEALARNLVASGGIKTTQRFMPRSRGRAFTSGHLDSNEQSTRSAPPPGALLELQVPQLTNTAIASEPATLKALTVVGARCFWIHFVLHSTGMFGKGRLGGTLSYDVSALEMSITQKQRAAQGTGGGLSGYKRMQSFSAARESVVTLAPSSSPLDSPNMPSIPGPPHAGGHPVVKAVKTLRIIEVPQKSVSRLADAAARLEAAYARRVGFIREWIFTGNVSSKSNFGGDKSSAANPFSVYYANTPTAHLSSHHPHNYYQHHYATFSKKLDVREDIAIRGLSMGTATVEVLSAPMTRSLVKSSELWMEHIVTLSPSTLAVLHDTLPQRAVVGMAAATMDTYASSSESRRDFKGNITVHQPTLYTSRRIRSYLDDDASSALPSSGALSTSNPIDELRRARLIQQDTAAQRLALGHRYLEESICCVGELFATEHTFHRLSRHLGAAKETDEMRLRRQAKIAFRVASRATSERSDSGASSQSDDERQVQPARAERASTLFITAPPKVGSIAARTGNAVTTSVRQPPLFLDLGFVIDILLESATGAN